MFFSVFEKNAIFSGLILFCSYSFAESFTLSEPIKVQARINHETQALRSYFSDRPEFMYFEDQSLGAASSVFLYGLDQRYIKIKFNGFNVVDASTPLGVVNLSQISGVRGLSVERYKTDLSINIKTHLQSKKSKWFIQGSQLGEFGSSVNLNKKNWNFKAGAARTGGFNQTFLGEEKDWTDDGYFSFDYKKNLSNIETSTHLFYSVQNQDYDDLFNAVEEAEGEAHFLLLGQKLKFEKFKVNLSYTLSNRVFIIEEKKGIDFQGKNFQSEFIYNKWFSFLLSLESNKHLDDQYAKVEVRPLESFRASFMWSRLRNQFFDMEWQPFNEISLFYKEIPASLFQINFHPSSKLKPQRAMGLKLFKDFSFKSIDFRFDGLYQYAFDQIEFVSSSMRYENFERSETIYSSLLASCKSYSLFIQAQRAKNLIQNLDLPRRPRWIVGFDYERAWEKVNFDLGLRWNSSLKAFDQTDLNSFWTSQLNVQYRNFHFVVINVLNQDRRSIFRDFRRRPITFKLHYGYEF